MGLKSAVWRYVKRLNPAQVQCTHCNKVLKWAGNTSNFWNHLKTHQIFPEGGDKKEKYENASSCDDQTNQSFQATSSNDLECGEFPLEKVFIERQDENTVEQVANYECFENEEIIESHDHDMKISMQSISSPKQANSSKDLDECVKPKKRKSHANTNQKYYDDCEHFGNFIVNEMKAINSLHLRKKFKRKVLQALLDVTTEDDGININIPLATAGKLPAS